MKSWGMDWADFILSCASQKKSAEIFYIKLDCRKRSPSMSSNIMRRKNSFCIPFTTEAATATTFCLDNQMYIDSIPYMKLCKRCGKGVITNIAIILGKRWKTQLSCQNYSPQGSILNLVINQKQSKTWLEKWTCLMSKVHKWAKYLNFVCLMV